MHSAGEAWARLGQRERGYAPDKWSSTDRWKDGQKDRLITINPNYSRPKFKNNFELLLKFSLPLMALIHINDTFSLPPPSLTLIGINITIQTFFTPWSLPILCWVLTFQTSPSLVLNLQQTTHSHLFFDVQLLVMCFLHHEFTGGAGPHTLVTCRNHLGQVTQEGECTTLGQMLFQVP